MDSLTLESGPCPRCHAENSRHIDECHVCGAPLPWRGYEANRVANLQAEAAARKDIAMWLRLLWLASGGVVFLLGIFLWCGDTFGLYPNLPGFGYLAIIAGTAILKRANDLS